MNTTMVLWQQIFVPSITLKSGKKGVILATKKLFVVFIASNFSPKKSYIIRVIERG